MYRFIEVATADGITWVTFNRPAKRNALSPSLNAEMLEALSALEHDPATDVVVLTGAGDAFSAGMDLKEYFRDNDDDAPAMERAKWVMRQWSYYKLRFFPKLTIAAVNGWCFGGAFTPLISCDFAIAAEEATFGLSEVNWGIIPGGSVTWDIGQVMGYRDALYYTLTGRTFSAARARELGLVNETVPLAGLTDAVVELARDLQRLNPAVLRAAKEAHHATRSMSYEQAYDYLSAKSAELLVRDAERGRSRGMGQFLDSKEIKPGLGPYARPQPNRD